jgi:mono/diheme cytochrome c family protein
MSAYAYVCLVGAMFVAGIVRGADAPPDAVRLFFEQHCMKCHGGESPEGDLKLAPLLKGEGDIDLLNKVVEKIETGQMPPKPEQRPAKDDKLAAADWLIARLAAAKSTQRDSEGRVVLRRLNRLEYENTLRDLLETEVRVQHLLPQDAAAGGFDNVGEALHTSSFLLERYLEAAEEALDQAIANGPQPKVKKEHVTLNEAYQVKQDSENVFRKREDGRVTMLSSSHWQAATLFWLEQRGRFRFRICVQADRSGTKPVTFSARTSGGSDGPKGMLAGYFDAPADAPKVIEFEAFMEPRMSLTILPYGLATAHEINKVGGANWTGPGLAVDWVEMEGPLNDRWPPKSHERIFAGLKQARVKVPGQNDRLEVQSDDSAADARRIIAMFARRAFRRPVGDDELAPFVALVSKRQEEGSSFEQAVRAGLTAVMTSPEFLFLRETPGRLDDFALASRLSYFLWSSMPDDELLSLAEQGQLHRPATLRAQVDRLLQSPKAAAFTENFTGQWLRLREIDFTEPSTILYPEFDEMLKVSMVREVHLLFDELLRQDLSIAHFLASDFSMLNGRLAKHYGIPDVDGWTFQRVTLPPGSHRGGVLTMAAILKVTANGTNTSPVLRGAWVLDRILGTPSKPPPPDAGSIEPDIRGAVTIREQLAQHRRSESCASCHAKIDPPGFALESFDVIGGYREHYRSTGNGKSVVINGKSMPYLQGRPVDAGDVMPDGREFANVDEFKELLVADLDTFARALTIRLLTYGTGGLVDASDQRKVSDILEKAKAKQWGFRSLIHEVVQSPLFLEK